MFAPEGFPDDEEGFHAVGSQLVVDNEALSPRNIGESDGARDGERDGVDDFATTVHVDLVVSGALGGNHADVAFVVDGQHFLIEEHELVGRHSHLLLDLLYVLLDQLRCAPVDQVARLMLAPVLPHELTQNPHIV